MIEQIQEECKRIEEQIIEEDKQKYQKKQESMKTCERCGKKVKFKDGDIDDSKFYCSDCLIIKCKNKLNKRVREKLRK